MKLITSYKVMLKPSEEQELLFRKSCGVSRWSYNYFLAESENHYKEYLKGHKETKTLYETDLRRFINNELKPTTHTWLKEVSSNVMKQAIKDASLARERWFKGISEKPKFKKKYKSKDSFYVNYESLKRTQKGFRGERLGEVVTTSPLPKIKDKYSNPRISFDGFNWFLSVGFEIEREEISLTNKSLGIDLGIKHLAVCSNGKVYKNINRSNRIKKLEKRLKRQQRNLSKKIESKKSKVKPLREYKNVNKQVLKIKKTHKKLSDIRTNYIHQTTTEIVKTKPSQIVMEDLNIRGMMKNKHLSKEIQNQCWFEFKRQIKYKSERLGILFVEVDRFYPSSKQCSKCGYIKKDLKLSDRIYSCSCGLNIDRDLNASINLANYSIYKVAN